MMEGVAAWEAALGRRCQSSSVTKGMKGCSSLHVHMLWPYKIDNWKQKLE